MAESFEITVVPVPSIGSSSQTNLRSLIRATALLRFDLTESVNCIPAAVRVAAIERRRILNWSIVSRLRILRDADREGRSQGQRKISRRKGAITKRDGDLG